MMEQFDLGTTKYRKRMYFCRKPNCGPCRDGKGHGPYWYAYQRENGRSVQHYLGVTLPAHVLQAWEKQVAASSVHPKDQPEIVTLRLFTLGTFRLEQRYGERWQTLPHTPPFPYEVRRLLGYLLTCPERAAACEHVLKALWPECSPTEGRLLLRKTVHTLTRILLTGNSSAHIEAYLQIQHDHLLLAGQKRIWVDADAIEHLLEPASHEGAIEHEGRLFEAQRLYQGDFLFEEQQATWAIPRRQSLRQGWMALTLSLAERVMARKAYAEAIELLHRLLAIDPLHEPAVQMLMKALTALDRRAEALRVHERFTHLLAQKSEIPVASPLPEKTESLANADLPERSIQRTTDRTHRYHFVGRVRELEELRALFDQGETNQPHPCFVGITGEAGIGKTRLMEYVLSEEQQRGWNSLWSRASQDERHVPYRIWTTLLQPLMDHQEWLWQAISQRPRVFSPLTKLLPAVSDHLPSLELTSFSSEQQEMQLWEAVYELLLLLSRHRPLVVVFDDLHWADRNSCRLLAYLTRHLRHHRILLLANSREQELSMSANEPLQALFITDERESTTRLIRLSQLDEHSLCTLIAEYAPLTPAWIHTIATHAAGNPFFAEEMARQAAQINVSAEEKQGIEHDEMRLPLPETIDTLLIQRMRYLSPFCRRLLGKAAVLGHAFPLTVLVAMETQAAGMQEETMLDLMDEALQAGMLLEEGGATSIAYQFWHPLLVRHLYDHLSAARRASYHRQAAHALKQVYRGTEDAATMVRHLQAGGDEEGELAVYAERAGDQGYQLAGYPEALHYYTLAVEHQDAHASPERLLILAEHLGECHMIRGNYAEARAAYTRALHLLEDSQPVPQDLQRVQRQALLWCEVGWTWRYTGEMKRAHECRQAAEQLLKDAGIVDGPAWASTYYQQSSLSWQEGRYQEALTAAQEALVLFERHLSKPQNLHTPPSRPFTRIERALTGDPVNLGRILTLLASIVATVGKNSDAVTCIEKALVVFEKQQSLREMAVAYVNLGNLFLRMAKHTEAENVLQRSLAIAERMGNRAVMCVNEGNLGILATRQGEMVQGEMLLRQAVQRAKQIGDTVYLSFWSAFLAESLSQRGTYIEALAFLRQAFRHGRGKSPCLNQAFVALSYIRLAYVTSSKRVVSYEKRHNLLTSILITIHRLLMDRSLEVETRIETYYLLAQVRFLLQDASAYQVALQALKEANDNEMFWLAKRLHSLLESQDSVAISAFS